MPKPRKHKTKSKYKAYVKLWPKMNGKEWLTYRFDSLEKFYLFLDKTWSNWKYINLRDNRKDKHIERLYNSNHPEVT